MNLVCFEMSRDEGSGKTVMCLTGQQVLVGSVCATNLNITSCVAAKKKWLRSYHDSDQFVVSQVSREIYNQLG